MRGFLCWLDPIIEQQATHYGLPKDRFTRLMKDAATHQELIEAAQVMENGEPWDDAPLFKQGMSSQMT